MIASLLPAIVFVFVGYVYAGQQQNPAISEQVSFCEDGPDETILKPIPLPSGVVTAVVNSRGANMAREWAEEKGRSFDPATLLKGTEIHLTSSTDRFYLLVATFPMSAADAAWFWIVRLSGNKASILLWVSANCVEISRRYAAGYRDIVTRWASANHSETMTYRYDGKIYKLWRRRSRPNN